MTNQAQLRAIVGLHVDHALQGDCTRQIQLREIFDLRRLKSEGLSEDRSGLSSASGATDDQSSWLVEQGECGRRSRHFGAADLIQGAIDIATWRRYFGVTMAQQRQASPHHQDLRTSICPSRSRTSKIRMGS